MGRPLLSTLLRAAFRAVLGERKPTQSGQLATRGITGDVHISRDEHGVPSITAATHDDAWFGLGFCHGQDRAGQLEILTRTVRGTLAEIAGRDALPIDRLSRRLGLMQVARAQLKAARPEIRSQIKAYARGVTAGATLGSPERAHDLVLFGCEPTPFEAEDAQGIMVLLCFALAANWDVELVRLEMLRRDGPEALLALEAAYPAHLHTVMHPSATAGESAKRLAEDLRAMAQVAPFGGASNAWAVSGKRTKSGFPILASDPHLEPVAPPHWYLAHLVAPGLRVRGASFVGVPAFAVGHNERVAWGVTAAHVDNTDLFLEEIGPDGASVREGDRFVPCEVRLESIAIKGETPILERVLTTKRGPLVGDAFDGAGTGLSIQATWLSGRAYTGFLGAATAKSAAEVHELFREAAASSATIVTADIDGHIGSQCCVEVPIRKGGSGLFPMPGWDARFGWEDALAPFESLPRTLDPEEGFVAAANNPPQPLDAIPYLGIDFLDGYRHRAIIEELNGRHDWDLAATQRLQRSVRSIPWEEIRETVLLTPCEGDAERAVKVLRGWGGDLGESAPGGSVYSLFIAHLTRAVVEAKAPKTAAHALGIGFNPLLPHNTMMTRRLGHLVWLIRHQPDGYFEGGWPRAIEGALASAIRELESKVGRDTAHWGWGHVRPIQLQHLFSRVNPLLDSVFGVGPIPFGGDSSTIAQGTVDLLNPRGNPLGTANLRAVMDLSDWRRSRFSLLGGQSGNPLSENYEDQIEAFRGVGFELAWTDRDIADRARHSLRLAPV